MLRPKGVRPGTGKLAHRIHGLGIHPHRFSRSLSNRATGLRVQREVPTEEGGAVLTTAQNVGTTARAVKNPTKESVLRSIQDVLLREPKRQKRDHKNPRRIE